MKTIYALAATVLLLAGVRIATAQRPTANAASAPVEPKHAGKIYEDDEVRVVIPAGWQVTDKIPVSSSVSDFHHTLLLTRNGYTLVLAFHTVQTSGIQGGRFSEVFGLPWADSTNDSADMGDCSLYLQTRPQPVNRVLLFQNVTMNTFDPNVRKFCGINADLGYWKKEGAGREYVGEERWFGGYFTTAEGGYFLSSQGKHCGAKVYTLNSNATTPANLPASGDTDLVQIIDEAIDIVASIHYKCCPPLKRR